MTSRNVEVEFRRWEQHFDYSPDKTYDPALARLLDQWHEETLTSSMLHVIPDYLSHVSRRDVPYMLQYLGSRPSWQVMMLLVRTTGASPVPSHFAGKFYHSVVCWLDWWECVGSREDWYAA